MSLRRRLIYSDVSENWDYVFYPADGGEEGEFLARALHVTAGQKVIINYYATLEQGYIVDFRDRGGLGPSVNGAGYFGWIAGGKTGNVNSDETIEFDIIKDADITVAGHRLTADGNLPSVASDKFYGRYIKIKIE